MDFLNDIESFRSILVICKEEEISKYQKLKEKFAKFQICSEIEALKEPGFDYILFDVISNNLTSQVASQLFTLLVPEGSLFIGEASQVEYYLKTNGFVNLTYYNGFIQAQKPKYAVGSSAQLNITKKATVWKLEDNEEDFIDPDDLLDETDLKRPDPSSLRVCGTTGQRKACKDCSCGLAEVLLTETQNNEVLSSSEIPKSSCGSCYLGDAFRCASCPYLGTPAFKPGEKIQLNASQLKSDI